MKRTRHSPEQLIAKLRDAVQQQRAELRDVLRVPIVAPAGIAPRESPAGVATVSAVC